MQTFKIFAKQNLKNLLLMNVSHESNTRQNFRDQNNQFEVVIKCKRKKKEKFGINAYKKKLSY